MLQIRLFGQFEIRVDGKRLVIPSWAGQSLLAYLALSAGASHRDLSADYMKFFAGDANAEANQPQLIVSYVLPQ